MKEQVNWEPPKDAKIRIVCAACKHGDFIAAGPRHFDETMHPQIMAYYKANGIDHNAHGEFEQGFIDQWGRFYDREAAMAIVEQNGQPFDVKRNSGNKFLFSEGLY